MSPPSITRSGVHGVAQLSAPSDVVHTTRDGSARSDRLLSPTIEVYGQLQIAYTFFNRQLFADQLPNCVITLQRSGKRTYGYFSADRFANGIGRVADEIALNPHFLKRRAFVDVMSTLVHEMVHLWQHHCGHPSRICYHNAEWARRMREVGLQASHTGAVGGRETGQRMTHYIIPGGRFELAAKELQASPLALSWFDADDIFVLTPTAPIPPKVGAATSGRRTKYTCPGCRSSAWGKPTLRLQCLDCDQPMLRGEPLASSAAETSVSTKGRPT